MRNKVLLRRAIMSASCLAVLLSCTIVEAGKNKGKEEKKVGLDYRQSQCDQKMQPTVYQDYVYSSDEDSLTILEPLMDVDEESDINNETQTSTSGLMEVDGESDVNDVSVTVPSVKHKTKKRLRKEDQQTSLQQNKAKRLRVEEDHNKEVLSTAKPVGVRNVYNPLNLKKEYYKSDWRKLSREIRMEFIKAMSIPELLDFNKEIGDVFRGEFQTGPVLHKKVEEYFYEAIQSVYKNLSYHDNQLEFTVDYAGIESNIETLVHVLRVLYNYKYYGFTSKIYDCVIDNLKDHDLWRSGALTALAKTKDNNAYLGVIRHILNFLDGGGRYPVIELPKPGTEKFYDALNPKVINALVELTLYRMIFLIHSVNNTTYLIDFSEHMRMLRKHLSMKNPDKTINELIVANMDGLENNDQIYTTINRIMPDIAKKRGVMASHLPKIYGGLSSPHVVPYHDIQRKFRSAMEEYRFHIYYYLLCGDSDKKICDQIVSNVGNFQNNYQASIYTAYLGRDDADTNLANIIVRNAVGYSSLKKADLYAAYLKRHDTNSETVDYILEEAEQMFEYEKCVVYGAYLRRQSANPRYAARIFDDAQNYRSSIEKSKLFEAYIESDGSCLLSVHEILENMKEFNAQCRSFIYIAYLKRFDHDTNMVNRIIQIAPKLGGFANSIYSAYFKYADVSLNVMENIFQKPAINLGNLCTIYLKRTDATEEIVEYIFSQYSHINLEKYNITKFCDRLEVYTLILKNPNIRARYLSDIEEGMLAYLRYLSSYKTDDFSNVYHGAFVLIEYFLEAYAVWNKVFYDESQIDHYKKLVQSNPRRRDNYNVHVKSGIGFEQTITDIL